MSFRSLSQCFGADSTCFVLESFTLTGFFDARTASGLFVLCTALLGNGGVDLEAFRFDLLKLAEHSESSSGCRATDGATTSSFRTGKVGARSACLSGALSCSWLGRYVLLLSALLFGSTAR